MPRRAVRIATLVAGTLTALGCVLWPEGGGPGAAAVPLAEALARRDGGEIVLVDVRSRGAYSQGHIPGALNIPSREVEGRAAEIRRLNRQPILYCG
jgi:hypothetical protein